MLKKCFRVILASFIVWRLISFMFVPMAAAGTNEMNRISMRPGSSVAEFYDTVTSAKFIPRGYNYTKLNPAYPDRHLQFNVGYYDAQEVEAMLSEMEYFGVNTVRVFIDIGSMSGTLYGVGGPPSTSTRGLYAPYMENFCDFLSRAKNHNIYVIPVLDGIPQNTYYITVGESNKPANVDNVNLYLLAQGYIDAKKQYVEDFITYIKNKDQSLLSTVLAYSLANEFYVLGNEKPFSMRSGTVTPADGITYDMSNVASRQACYDNGIRYYVNQIVPVTTAVDSNAKVILGIFTNYAVGRSGPSGVMWNPGEDPRFPPRPYALANVSNSLHAIDIHLYPVGQSIDTDLNSIEWSIVNKNYKPFLLGEFGAEENYFSGGTGQAAAAMVSFRQQAYDRGFTGSLFWTWNNVGQNFWTAKEGNREIRNSLSGMNVPTFEDDFNDGDYNGWSTIDGTWAVEYGHLSQSDMSTTYKGAVINGHTFSNFSAEVFLIILNQNGGNWAGIQFRKSHPSHVPWQSGYMAYIRNDGTVAVYKPGTGDIAAASTGLNPAASWVKMRVEAFDNVIKVYVNDVLYIQVTDNDYSSGYISLTSYSNHVHFNDVFIKNYQFCDSFNDGNLYGWSTYGTWAVENGELSQSNTVADRSATISSMTFSNLSCQFKFRILSHGSDSWTALQVRKTNLSDSPWASGYLVFMRPDGYLAVYKAGTGEIASYATGLNPVNGFVTIKAEFIGSNIRVYANNKPYINITDPAFTSGYCSLVTYNNHSHFDDITIK